MSHFTDSCRCVGARHCDYYVLGAQTSGWSGTRLWPEAWSYVGVGERVLSWRTTSGILCTTTTSVMGHTPESDIGLKRSSCVACEARLYVSVVSV